MAPVVAIRGLETVSETYLIDLTSDSQYVRKGITEWLEGKGLEDGRQKAGEK